MRTIVVEEWVHIPEGGIVSGTVLTLVYSYLDSEDQKSAGEGPQG